MKKTNYILGRTIEGDFEIFPEYESTPEYKAYLDAKDYFRRKEGNIREEVEGEFGILNPEHDPEKGLWESMFIPKFLNEEEISSLVKDRISKEIKKEEIRKENWEPKSFHIEDEIFSIHIEYGEDSGRDDFGDVCSNAFTSIKITKK